MSTLAIAQRGYSPTYGGGDAAQRVAHSGWDIVNHIQGSAILGLRSKGVLDELIDVRAECANANWDGYGAVPLIEDSVALTFNFLFALPIGIAAPSVSADPDGQVSLEWYRSPTQILTVSVDPEGFLHYAGSLGSRKAYGTEPFLGNVPRVILEWIGQVASS